MQHAIGSRPDPAHGYCVDDVARALQVDLLHGRELGWAAVGRARVAQPPRSSRDAFDPATGRFRNFRASTARGSTAAAPRTARAGRCSPSATRSPGRPTRGMVARRDVAVRPGPARGRRG